MSVFSVRACDLFAGTSILIVEPGVMGTASWDGSRIAVGLVVVGPEGESGPKPPLAARPSDADKDLGFRGLVTPFAKVLLSVYHEIC